MIFLIGIALCGVFIGAMIWWLVRHEPKLNRRLSGREAYRRMIERQRRERRARHDM